MDNKLKSCLIASTPHPQSRKILRNVFENDTSVLSPICQLSSLPSVKPTKPKSKLALCPDNMNRVKKRKYSTDEKVSGSATVQRLRGTATATSALRTNTLAHSRNTNCSNKYPEPIVLDSDEEEKFLKSITTHRNTPQKKVTKSAAETAQPDKKRTASTKISTTVVLDSDEEEKFLESIQKPTSEKKLTKTNTAKLKKSDKNRKVDEKAVESKKPDESRSKLPRIAKTNCPQQKKEAAHSSSKASGIRYPQPKPLGNLENIQPTTKRTKLVKKSTKPTAVTETDPNDIVLDEEESPFPDLPVNFSKTTKVVNLNYTPIVQDLIDKNTIKWTPRTSRKVRKTSISSLSEEETDEKRNIEKESKEATVDNTIIIDTHSKPLDTVKSIEDLPNEATLRGCKKQKQQTKNSFPAVYLSQFENIVFKPSPHSGGIVAKSLETDTLTFGYVEVKGGETFSGQRPHVTFIMLEGQVKASVQGATQTLFPGDIIHIDEVSDSKYHFQNVGSDHSRLLFVKKKNCS